MFTIQDGYKNQEQSTSKTANLWPIFMKSDTVAILKLYYLYIFAQTSLDTIKINQEVH